MKRNRSNRLILETAILVTLCGLILSVTLATLVQIDKEMIAIEMAPPTRSLVGRIIEDGLFHRGQVNRKDREADVVEILERLH
jgi:hypothetical protein